MADAPKLTRARRDALAVLLEGERSERSVRVSNVTSLARPLGHTLSVYWQVADWLHGNGYATRHRQLGADTLTLTAMGRELAGATHGG